MNRLAFLSTNDPQTLDAAPWAGVREEIEQYLRLAGYETYRPDSAFSDTSTPSAVRVEVSRAVIVRSAAGVVLVSALGRSMQAAVEVEAMIAAKLPVLIVTDLERSAQVDDWILRGVQVCRPEEVQPWVKGVVDLAETRRAAQTPIQTALGTMRQMFESMGRAAQKPALIFEPADGTEPEAPAPQLPTRGYSDDAGLDLYVVGDRVIPPGKFRDVPCGVKVDIPAGHWGMITGRSSTLRKRGLLVNPGVIDAGWTGELFAGVQNLSDQDVIILHGDRLAQLILLPAPVTGYLPEWGRVPDKERGTSGFGSTGT